MKNDRSLHRVRFGPYEADFSTREIWKHETKIKLVGQPFEILVLLVSRAGELVAREELERLLWPEGHFVDATHGLNAAVNKLRDALCDSADSPKYIETLPRRGYRFIGEVVNAGDESRERRAFELAQQVVPEQQNVEREIGARSTAEVTVEPILQPEIVMPASVMSRRWPILATAAMALVFGSLIGFVLTGRIRQRPDAAESAKQSAERKRQAEITSARSSVDAERHRPDAPALKANAKSAPDFLPRRQGYGTLQMAEFRTIIPGDAGNAAPQFSPDGKRIIFMSNRSGPWQIWMSNIDGSDPVQVSFTDSAGTPRWSPDGKSFAFDAPWNGSTHVFVAPIDQPKQARPVAEGCVPSFSRDGKFVYFASDRTGGWQIWKASVNGGDALQLTTHGGFAALESPDGNIYYAKSWDENPEIWREPVGGGDETLVTSMVKPRTWKSWTVTRGGLLLFSDTPDGKTYLSFYDPVSSTDRELAPLKNAAYWMGATSDGSKVVMNDGAERQITMLDHLR